MDSASGGRPRYQQLARTLIERIEAGVYPVGGTLPTEQELTAEFGVSRHTVREALRILSLQRYVHRRQGSGSEVISAAPQAVYRHAMRSLSELFEYAADTRLDLRRVAMTEPDAALAAELGRMPGRRWLMAEGVRRARGGDAISFTRIFIHEEFAALEGELGRLPGPIYAEIERRFGVRVEEVAQEISAEPFAPEAAAALGVAPGTMAVRMMRRYLDEADRPLIVSMSWHPAETFSYGMRLRREDRAG
ncbi:MAG: GntR family transcriptional regulator [Paracoccaceae bacterium]|nr:MAG: GntR family transcriptional regulator [Paracoccaceae bacterium]